MKKYLNCVCGHVYYICSIQLTFPCWSITYLTYNTHICSAEILVGGPKGPSDKVSLYSWIRWGLTISLKIYMLWYHFGESKPCIYRCKYVFDSTYISSSFVFFFFFSGFHYWTNQGSEESRSNVEGKDVGRVLELCYPPCVCLYFDP